MTRAALLFLAFLFGRRFGRYEGERTAVKRQLMLIRGGRA